MYVRVCTHTHVCVCVEGGVKLSRQIKEVMVLYVILFSESFSEDSLAVHKLSIAALSVLVKFNPQQNCLSRRFHTSEG